MNVLNLVETFSLEKLFLGMEGFYPTKKKTLSNFYSATFITVLSLLQWTLMVFYLLLSQRGQKLDWIKITEHLLFFMTQSAFLSKLINFIIQKNKMLVIEELLRKTTLCNVDDAEKKLFKEYMQSVRLLAKIFRFLCVFATVFYGIFPLLDKSDEESKNLPIRLWFPFKIDKSYYFIWFMTSLSIVFTAWTNSNIDILNVTLITLATAEFEILKKRLRNIVPDNEDEEINEALIRRKLKESIIHFYDINSFVVVVEATFSKGIFVQFACSVLVICLTGFQMLVIPVKSMQFIQLLSYFNCMLFQIFMYCWYGDMLMNSSDGISEACYSSGWFKCSASVQKIFITILERAKVPVKMRAAGFFTINLPTLMAILRSSYSYFAVLRHVYSEKLSGKK